MHRRRSIAGGVALLGLLPTPVTAHALGARIATPIPLALYLGGAGLVVLAVPTLTSVLRR